MPVIPKIPKPQLTLKTCARCGLAQPSENYAPTRSFFYPDGRAPICNGCISVYLRDAHYEWDAVDRLCRWLDIPFIVKEWARLCEMNGEDKTWPVYASVFADQCYESIGWADYFKQYTKLREVGLIEDEIPLVHEQNIKRLRDAWGANYSEEDLVYLEDLFKGLLTSQNVNGALQVDQARKLCKLSLEIDERIRAGDKDVDKFVATYDKIVKVADFTPKNAKNDADFDSFAELGLWLEKRGRQNKFYDGTTRDVIDETLKNIENYNQRLYINEGGIGDEITQRLQALNLANAQEEAIYNLQKEYNLDDYDNDGFNVEESDEDEFIIDEGDE